MNRWANNGIAVTEREEPKGPCAWHHNQTALSPDEVAMCTGCNELLAYEDCKGCGERHLGESRPENESVDKQWSITESGWVGCTDCVTRQEIRDERNEEQDDEDDWGDALLWHLEEEREKKEGNP